MYMIDDSKEIYFIGGFTSILSGLLMIFTSIWFITQNDQYDDVIHGVSVVMVILIVPTVIATTVLLINDVRTGALLGLGFASLWLIVELLAQGCMSAPMKYITDMIATPESKEFGETFIEVWKKWGNTLTKIGAFSFSLAAVCYGLSLRMWGNSTSAYLLIIAAITFPITFIPAVDLDWHFLTRGIAFLFLGGVLILATRHSLPDEWET